MAHEDMDRVLSRRLRALDHPARLELARETVERLGSRFDSNVCSLLAEELDRAGGPLPQAWLDTLPDTPNGAWFPPQLLSDSSPLVPAWERFISFKARRDPLDLLAWSRALAATGAYEEAAQKLRLEIGRA